MVKSMTGYGKASAVVADRTVGVEIKALNHRYTEIFCRLPAEFYPHETVVRKMIAERVSRGKIELVVKIEGASGEAVLKLNEDFVRSYHAMLLRMKEMLGLKDEIKLADIAAAKGIFSHGEEEDAPEIAAADLLAIVSAALDSLEEMKLQEGKNLQADIAGRLLTMQGVVKGIEERVPLCLQEYQARLQRRVKDLTEGIDIDAGRLAQEIAIIADRSDISEEITRLHSHFSQLEHFLRDDEGGDKGRKMDFLLQEMAREVNTLGSKSGDGDIARGVIALKSELAKIREQVQNIE